jgi:hypothetical protein
MRVTRRSKPPKMPVKNADINSQIFSSFSIGLRCQRQNKKVKPACKIANANEQPGPSGCHAPSCCEFT